MIIISDNGKYLLFRFLLTVEKLTLFDVGEIAEQWTISSQFGRMWRIDADGNSYFVEEVCRPRSENQVG